MVNTIVAALMFVTASLAETFGFIADGEIFLGGNRRKRAVHKRQTACAFRATTIDAKCDAVLACRKIVKIADFKRARLNIYLGHTNCAGLAGVGDCGIVGADHIAVNERNRQRGGNRTRNRRNRIDHGERHRHARLGRFRCRRATASDRIIVSASRKVISFFLSITAPPSATNTLCARSALCSACRSACRHDKP